MLSTVQFNTSRSNYVRTSKEKQQVSFGMEMSPRTLTTCRKGISGITHISETFRNVFRNIISHFNNLVIKQGEVNFFDRYGNKIKTYSYEKGELNKIHFFGKNGNLQKSHHYNNGKLSMIKHYNEKNEVTCLNFYRKDGTLVSSHLRNYTWICDSKGNRLYTVSPNAR